MSRGGGLSPFALLSTVRKARAAAPEKTIAVAGAAALVPMLAKELRAGGRPAAIREGFDPERRDVAALVWVGEPDEDALRAAAAHRVPIVAITDAEQVPYVLATDVVRVPPGQGLPVERVVRSLARKVSDAGPGLAAALPVLREAVVDELIRSAARTNAVLAAGIGVPSVGMPVLTLSQVRLVTKIAVAHGRAIDRSVAAEVVGVVGAGFGFRAFAREGLRALPRAAWATRGAVALAGTVAVGEAARRLFAPDAD